MDRSAARIPPFSQLNLFDPEAKRGPVPGRTDEVRFILLRGRAVPYRFARRRRRTLGITVDRDGVSVSAPIRAPWRDIEAFLRDKDAWILGKLEEWSRRPRAVRLQGATGETLPLFGRSVVLDVREGGRAVRHLADRLVVCAPDPSRALEVLLGWLKTRALETLGPRVLHYAEQLGVPAPRVSLSSARTQWGVCFQEGRIRLNWRLVHLEPAVSDYVAAHEVAHLVEMNHSRRFWSVVAALYPDWKAARRRLEEAGAALPVIQGRR